MMHALWVKHECIGWMDKWMDGWMDGWMDRWINGPHDGINE